MTTPPPVWIINNVSHTPQACESITKKTRCTVKIEWVGPSTNGNYLVVNQLIKLVDQDGNETKARTTTVGKRPPDNLGGIVTLYKGKPQLLSIIFETQASGKVSLNYMEHLADLTLR